MNKPNSKKRLELAQRRDAPLATRTDLSVEAVKDISGAMNAILADGVQCKCAELSNSLGDRICHRKKLVGLLVQ